MADELPEPIISATEIITVEKMIEKLSKNKKIDLNPIFQRDIVWNEQKMSAFIDSLMRGYVPGNITVNVNTDEDAWTCIDGKQRITSIMNFWRNKIPWTRVDDDDDDVFIYFNNIPEDKKDEKNYYSLNKKQQQFFLERSVIIVTYNDLGYQLQCEIFNRIQNSMAATSGEQCFSLFKNSAVASKFKEFCRKNDYAKRPRFRNVDIILNIFYMKKNRELKALSGKKERLKFISELDDMEEYDTVINMIQDDLKVYFSEDLIAHKDLLSKKMPKNFIIAIFYLMGLEKTKLKTLEKKYFIDVRKMIGKMWDRWSVIDGEINKDRSKMNVKVLERIEKIYDKLKAPFTHPGKKVSNKDDSDDSDDDSDEDSDGETDKDSGSDSDDSDKKTKKGKKEIKKEVKKTVREAIKPKKRPAVKFSDMEPDSDNDKSEKESDESDESDNSDNDKEVTKKSNKPSKEITKGKTVYKKK